MVRAGDVLTIAGEAGIRILRIVSAGVRRGPATEARLLYEDLTPPAAPQSPDVTAPDGLRSPGAGRPTKRDRRVLDDFRSAGSDDFLDNDD